MPTRPLSDNDAREAYDAVSRLKSVTLAADELGLSRSTVQDRFTASMRTFGLPDPRGGQFIAPTMLNRERGLDDLLDHRRKESSRMRAVDSAEQLIDVQLLTDGPVGFAAFGDPHIDSPGCDFNLLERHLEIAAKRSDYVFAGNIGDLQDSWVGRLARLYESTTVSGREAWRLVEWMIRDSGVRWTWLVRGNHDAWNGRNDPLDWISASAGVGVDKHWGARIRFKHPNGTDTTMHARHDFPGSSMTNPLHALKRETLHGPRDDVLIAGHRHSGADARDTNGDGNPFCMVRVSGFKVSDSFAYEKGFYRRPMHPAAMIVVNPDEPRESPSRIWVAPSFEVGADYLDFLRQRFNSRPRQKAKPPQKDEAPAAPLRKPR